MRTSITGLSALAIAILSTPAYAQDETDPPESSVTISGSATVVSDYRFRGISQTDKHFALQGGIGLSHESGFYVSVWGSSIDDYVANGSDQEIDFIGGWKKDFDGTVLDVGLLYYFYPGGNGANTDFFEPYVSVSHTLGPVSAKLTANYAWKQNALTVGNGKEDNLYVAGDFSTAIPETPLTLSAHIGHSFGPSYLTIGDEYTDWNVGVSYSYRNLTLGMQYVDTDGTFIAPSGKNVSKGGVLASLGVAF